MRKKWDLRRILTLCLGGFWLLDGILQLQPAMFTQAFISTVLAPNLQNQPAIIENIVAFGIHLFSTNLFWWNLASALLQVFIGIILIFPFQERVQRVGLWLSVVWAFVIWIFGEGFGNIFTGSATFYTGAPGSALLYLILALCLLYPFYERLPMIAGMIFILDALLNLTPMFWQPTMLSMLAMTPSVSTALGTFGAHGTMIGNLIAIDALMLLGLLLIFIANRSVGWIAIGFLLLIWSVSQSFGGIQTFPFGTATDPNSAPLLILFLLPIILPQADVASKGARNRGGSGQGS